jgi:hypothetical protein
MRRVSLGLTLALSLGFAAAAQAQGSIFGIEGLGWAARPVSARSAGMAGSLAMFDPEMSANPAALTRWRSLAAWGVAAPTKRSYTSPSVSADQQTVRFPLFGFASVLPPTTVISFSISDYLDRTWTLQESDSMTLRGVTEKFTDAGRSIGGVSDMQLGVGHRMSSTFFIGAGFHYYLGSTRLTAQRLYANAAFDQVLEQSQTDFRGMGVGAGVLWTLPRIDIAASGRLNGRLRSHNSSGEVAHTHLPAQVGLGLRWQAVPGVFLAGSAQYDAWATASPDLRGTDASRNVWSIGIGTEVTSVTLLGIHTPLRLGYRMRTLPFTTQGQSITENALAGGFGLSLAHDRTTLDVGVESGTRKAGAAKETFQSVFVGITVRP